MAKQLAGKQGDDKAKAEDKIKEQQTEEILISIAQDERNDTIPENQKKLIEKHQNKFKDFTATNKNE